MNLYVIQNKEGDFFRAKGYGGYGDTWVENLDRARIYTKIGQARSRVSFFFNAYPEYGIPDILQFEIDLSKAKILDESQRVLKQKDKKDISLQNVEIREAERKKKDLEEKIKKAQEELKKYK